MDKLMMYKIDLLAGRGLPPKSQPGLIAAMSSSFVVPLIILSVLTVIWMQNRTVLLSQTAACTQHEKQIQRFRQDLQEYENNKQIISRNRDMLTKISRELYFEMQLTPILKDLVAALPPLLLIEEVDFEYNPGRKKKIDKENNNSRYVSVVNRVLHVSVIGTADSASDQAVKTFVENLRQSSSIIDRFRDIQIASRREVPDKDQRHLLYEIECVFQEQNTP